MKTSHVSLSLLTLASLSAAPAMAQDLNITVTNTQASGGFSFTPVWYSFHNGNYDTFDLGASAAGFSGLTELAEGGVTSGLDARANADSPANISGTIASTNIGPAPVFSPTETQNATVSPINPAAYRYFSFASMIIPTNDLFIGNDNATAYEIYNAAGEFNGPVTIEVYGRDVWDNGSEVNNAAGGAAFSSNGGMDADENGLITRFFDDTGASTYLDSFVGSGTVDGGSVSGTFGADDLIATITITQVPAPATAAVGVLSLGLLSRRRRA